jgi:hypothetical protein
VIVLQVPQGHYSIKDTRFLVPTLHMFDERSREFLIDQPQCRRFHRAQWQVIEVGDAATAPFGYEWYQVGQDGFLQLHSADYDSSD